MNELVLFTISKGDWSMTAQSCIGIVSKFYIGIEGIPEGMVLCDKPPFFVVGVGHLYQNGFSALRNNLLRYISTGDWCLMLDDDEAIEEYRNLSRVGQTDRYYAYMLHLHQWHHQSGGRRTFCKDTLYRLFKKVDGIKFHGMVHEQIIYSYIEQGLPIGGAIPGGRIIHLGYDKDKLPFIDKIIRNMGLLWSGIWRDGSRQGYDYYHLGEMRLWYRDYGGALEAYKLSKEKGLSNPKIINKVDKQIDMIESFIKKVCQ